MRLELIYGFLILLPFYPLISIVIAAYEIQSCCMYSNVNSPFSPCCSRSPFTEGNYTASFGLFTHEGRGEHACKVAEPSPAVVVMIARKPKTRVPRV